MLLQSGRRRQGAPSASPLGIPRVFDPEVEKSPGLRGFPFGIGELHRHSAQDPYPGPFWRRSPFPLPGQPDPAGRPFRLPVCRNAGPGIRQQAGKESCPVPHSFSVKGSGSTVPQFVYCALTVLPDMQNRSAIQRTGSVICTAAVIMDSSLCQILTTTVDSNSLPLFFCA